MGKSYTMDKSTTPLKVPMPKPFHYDINNITIPPPSPSLTSALNSGTSWITTSIQPPNTTWANTNKWVDRDNLFHNTSGPAAITRAEAKWFIDGKQYTNTKLFCQDAKHDDETTLMWVLTYGDTLPSEPEDVKYIECNFKS